MNHPCDKTNEPCQWENLYLVVRKRLGETYNERDAYKAAQVATANFARNLTNERDALRDALRSVLNDPTGSANTLHARRVLQDVSIRESGYTPDNIDASFEPASSIRAVLR